jgi:hypothetical protein
LVLDTTTVFLKMSNCCCASPSQRFFTSSLMDSTATFHCLTPLSAFRNYPVHPVRSPRWGPRGSSVVKALCYMPEGRRFETQWCNRILSVYIILPAEPGPEVYWASQRNEYQEIECGLFMRVTISPPPASRLSRQYGIRNVSQSYRPPRPVTGIALLATYLQIQIFLTTDGLSDSLSWCQATVWDLWANSLSPRYFI